MSATLLVVASYGLLAVFLVVFGYRTIKIARLPVHLRWELAPVPHEKGKGHYGGSYLEEYEWWTKPREKSLISELIYMFEEIVFLKGVWKHNRSLWWFSFPFHLGMYLLIVAAVLLMIGAIWGLAQSPTSTWAGPTTAVSTLAAGGFVLGGIGALGLLVSRLSRPRLKATNTPASLFNLLLLLAVFVSGGWALLASDGFAARTSAFVQALLTADLGVETPGILATHLLIALLFVAYLPFSQMMHFVAKYFTYHQVRWDDNPLEPGSRLEAEVQKLLNQPVTWSAPHLGADGRKNWVDIATEETSQ